MTLAAMLRLAFAILFASFHHVSADFDILEFPSNATDYICPGMDFACVAPAICAHEFVTDQYFCCLPIGGACTTTAQTCGIPSKPSPLALYNSAPLPTQQACNLSNASGYCCDNFQQQCAGDDSTACWSDRTNLIRNISNTVMNRTFSALTSANPSATAYTVKIEDLALGIIPTSILSANTNPPSSLPHLKEGSRALSSSEIGGIVGGVVGGLLLSGLVILLLWRRQQIAKRAHGLAMQRESLSSSGDIPDLPEIKQPIIAEAPAQESYDAQELTAAGQLPVESPTDRQLPVEARGDESHPFEVEANTPVELDGTTAPPRDIRSDRNRVEKDHRTTSRDTSASGSASP